MLAYVRQIATQHAMQITGAASQDPDNQLVNCAFSAARFFM
jgi:hypothetical protein